ncbi:hypothetical protein [Pseudomonas fitomaticsae]|uniref:Uncharacterized protein n=1 Tax=Pseudomonas fitomaticsae TaxID=2837969 RepID=A0ABY3Q7T5_9PSED|nr:hypothetical protein [Pseudomonas fitomaticsae]UFQ02227.1 hypothetical protein KJY40_11240 [Pseudomonas fitomaticsae]
MSDKQCEANHSWRRVSQRRGDPGAVNGSVHYSYLECRECGEEDHSHPNPEFYACEPED